MIGGTAGRLACCSPRTEGGASVSWLLLRTQLLRSRWELVLAIVIAEPLRILASRLVDAPITVSFAKETSPRALAVGSNGKLRRGRCALRPRMAPCCGEGVAPCCGEGEPGLPTARSQTGSRTASARSVTFPRASLTVLVPSSPPNNRLRDGTYRQRDPQELALNATRLAAEASIACSKPRVYGCKRRGGAHRGLQPRSRSGSRCRRDVAARAQRAAL